jgi:hypothetical protein
MVRVTDGDDSFEAEVTEQHDHSGDTFAHVEELDGERSGWVELN